MGSAGSKKVPPPQPQISSLTHKDFDLSKFAGGQTDHWYEIARSKNGFEKECDFVTHSFYIGGARPANSAGSVFTGCYGPDKKLKFYQEGYLYIKNPNDTSKMEIQYKSWFGGRAIDFWVYDTDNTTYALIGNTRGDVWLLSRTPTMTICTVEKVYKTMIEKGFDVNPTNFIVKLGYLTKC